MALPAKFRSATLFLLMIAGLALSAQTASSAECWGETNIILGDFNDDGRQDLVIGSPFSLVALAGEAGVVHVLYGTASGPGFSVLPQQLWYLDLPGIPGDSESSDNFGRSLAVGDFDCDGIDDLVIGEKEAVTVLYGSIPGGLTTTGVQRLTGTIGSGFGRAVAAGHTEGFVKIIRDAEYSEILGAHIVGAHATELIAEFVIGRHLESTVEEMEKAMHPHPTLSEGVSEGALAALGRPIHM